MPVNDENLAPARPTSSDAGAKPLELEQAYRNLVSALPVGVHFYRLDAPGDADSISLIDANREATTLPPRDLTSALGTSLEHSVPAADHIGLAAACMRALDTKQAQTLPEVQLDLDDRGPARTYCVTALPVGDAVVAVLFENITESVQAGRALRAIERKWQELYDAAPDMMVAVDPATATIKECNQSVVDNLGYAKAETIGRPVFDFYDPGCMAKVREAFRSFATTGTVPDTELRLTRKDGSKLDVSLKVSAVRDSDGTILLSSSVWRDITERKQAERAERNLLDRLALLGSLSAGIAHEINNPAFVIHASLGEMKLQLDDLRASYETVASRPELDGIAASLRELDQLRDDSADSIDSIVSIVRDLKQLTGLESNEHEWVDVNEIVETVCHLASNQLRHRAQLHKRLRDVPAIAGHRQKLLQVVTNLLVNAIDAIVGGHVSANTIGVDTRKIGDEIQLVVRDTGCGIPTEARARIFEPFFTTKSKGRGTGLGLAISAEIVRAHGGRIEVSSAPSEGTEFRVLLPVETGLAVASAPPPVDTITATSSLRVLVVDDEPMIRRTLQRMLPASYSVVHATGGRAAVELLENDDRFDIVLCDLMMPDGDGAMVHSAVARRSPHLLSRLAFLSGGAFTGNVIDFVDRVKPLVLDKPIRKDTLVRTIERLARPQR